MLSNWCRHTPIASERRPSSRMGQLGAGPRASQYSSWGHKARAVLHGRFAASVEDVQALAKSVLRHPHHQQFRRRSEERITSCRSSTACWPRSSPSVPDGRQTELFRSAHALQGLEPPAPRPYVVEGLISVFTSPYKGSASSSPNTANTRRGMRFATSTGRPTPSSTAITSRSTRKKPISAVTCWSMPVPR
jgi:hypothetical protein